MTTPHPPRTALQAEAANLAEREALLQERNTLRAEAAKLQSYLADAHGPARTRLLQQRGELDRKLSVLNKRIKEAHDRGFNVPQSLWRRVALAADEYLFGESDDDHAADMLEEALEALDRADPLWRQR